MLQKLAGNVKNVEDADGDDAKLRRQVIRYLFLLSNLLSKLFGEATCYLILIILIIILYCVNSIFPPLLHQR